MWAEINSDALHIHEIRHVALSLDSPKGLTFNQYDQLMPTTITGLKDEISGYSAQHGYDPTSLPGVYPSTLEGINKEYIGNIKNDATGDYIYKSIRQLWLNEMKQNKINEKNKKNKN